MDRNTSTVILLALLHLCVTCLVTTQSQLLPIVDDKGGNAPGMQTYIVHVQEPQGGTKLLGEEELKNWHKSFLPNTTLDSGVPRLVYSYRHAISGFAARLTAEEVNAMQSKDGFLYAHPDNELVGATTYTWSFLGLDQSNGPWLNTTGGEGIIIGMIDSGITPGHPSFSDDGTFPARPAKWTGQCNLSPYSCNNKLIGAVGFLGGNPASPIDQNGHGTHTAGTAAGNPVDNAQVLGNAQGRAIGAAPRAHLAIYRVLDQNNRGSESDFLKGIDQAIADGVDVLSMSLGSSPIPFYQSGIAVASFSAIIKGIFPCAAAGNSGPQANSISNDAPWLLTVGASSFDRSITATVKLGNGTELDGQSAYQPTSTTSQLPLIYPGLIFNTQEAYACQKSAIDQLDVTGKIVLCVSTIFYDSQEKGVVVKTAGGAGMIVLNSLDRGFTTFADPHILPASHTSNRDALTIVNYFQASTNPTAEIIFKGTQFGARPSPTVASFSSRGPSLMNGGILKPDILGPGLNVLAAWPFQLAPTPTGTANFNFLSGTSMATPHVSGIAAIIKKYHSDWSPAAIKSAIMTTARTLDLDSSSIKDDAIDHRPASPFAKGAGLVQPARAMDPGLVYDLQPVDYIPYLCGMYDSNTVQAIVRQRVQCSAYQPIGAEGLNYPSCALTLAPSQKKIIGRILTNVGSDSSYSLRIVEPAGVSVIADTYHLQFSQLYEKQSFRLQFTNKASTSMAGTVSEGYLEWFSVKYTVRSPIVVAFT